MYYDIKKIGERIHQERTILGLTMEEFGRFLGTTRQNVSSWEKGTAKGLALDDLLKMCEIFNCELGYLLCEFDCKTRENTDISAITGLTEEAIEQLIEKHYLLSSIALLPEISNIVSNILCDDTFWSAIISMIYASNSLWEFKKSYAALSSKNTEELTKLFGYMKILSDAGFSVSPKLSAVEDYQNNAKSKMSQLSDSTINNIKKKLSEIPPVWDESFVKSWFFVSKYSSNEGDHIPTIEELEKFIDEYNSLHI